MKSFSALFAGLLLSSLIITTSVQSLKCYVCSFYELGIFEESPQANCGKTTLVECKPGVKSCFATRFHPDGGASPNGGGGGKKGCAEPGKAEDFCKMDTYAHTKDFKEPMLHCRCQTDGCNSDPKNITICTSCAGKKLKYEKI